MTGTVHRLAVVPNHPFLNEQEVTINRLASILSSAVIETEVDEDGDLVAVDGLPQPVWITMEHHKMLNFTACRVYSDEVARKVRFSEINALNREFLVVQCHWQEDALLGVYSMTYDGGLDPRQFVKILRHFSEAFYGFAFELQDRVS